MNEIEEILHWLEAGEVAEARRRIVSLRRRWQGVTARKQQVAMLLEARKLLAGKPGARRQNQAWYRLQGLGLAVQGLAERGIPAERAGWG